jgi:hypothetical protein
MHKFRMMSALSDISTSRQVDIAVKEDLRGGLANRV